MFPEVAEAGTVIGQVSGGAFSQTGLAPGTPVVAGGLDTALGLAGPRPAVPGPAHGHRRELLEADGGGARARRGAGRLRTICHIRPGQWLVEGIGFYAGFALRWLRDRAAEGRRPRATLRRAGGTGRGGTARGGRLTARLVPADAWTWARWQPPLPPRPGAVRAGLGEQARAIQEAAAYSTRRAAGLVSELLGPGAWQEVILTGGAARSRLWPQILADVLGYRVSVPEHTESAARGAAILAGRAAGVLPEDLPEDPPPGQQPDDAGHAVPGLERATCPSLARQRAYDQLYARWLHWS